MKKIFALAAIATTAMFMACGNDGDSSNNAKGSDNENAADSLDADKAVTANFQCDYVDDATSKIALKAVGSSILHYDSVAVTFTRGESQDKIVLDSMTIDPEETTYTKTLYDVSTVQLQYMIHRYCVDSTEVTDENGALLSGLGCVEQETADMIYFSFTAPGVLSENASAAKNTDFVLISAYLEDPDYSSSDYCDNLKKTFETARCQVHGNYATSSITLTTSAPDSVWNKFEERCKSVSEEIADYTKFLSSSSKAKEESSSSETDSSSSETASKE